MNAPAKGPGRTTSPHAEDGDAGADKRQTELFAEDSPLPWGALSTLATLLTYLADPLGHRPQDPGTEAEEKESGRK